MKEFLDALGTYISSYGFATPGTDLFYDHLPGTPYAAVGVFLTGGPYLPRDPKTIKTFQVVVRNTDPTTARTLANSIYSLFNKVPCDRSTCKMSGYDGWFYPQHEPGPHDYDENNHIRYTLNFRLESLQ